MPDLWRILAVLLLVLPSVAAQEEHSHSAPEKLGRVSFPNSCAAAVQEQFDRGVALLHSFAYSAAEKAFQGVAEGDPQCAMAHWGAAMSYFHQLWEPAIAPAILSTGQREIERAQQMGAGSERERQFIHALGLVYQDSATVPYRTRSANYEHAMSDLASGNGKDVEAQVFYALALLANASPADKTHAKQKQAADLLEPLDRAYPQHPGIPHYLIHAYDNAELAPRGWAAAKAYSQIAPSAPHALHMPSHIFTRLGLWEDSIASNRAAREAAHREGDTGEELHAMDYLVYAYLQSGRDKDANEVIQQLEAMPKLDAGEFQNRVRLDRDANPLRSGARGRSARRRHRPTAGTPAHIVAITSPSRPGVGREWTRRGAPGDRELRKIEEQLRKGGNGYWGRPVQSHGKSWRGQTRRRRNR